MPKSNASPNVIPADQLKGAALDAIGNNNVLGLLIMAGQTGIRVQSDVGTWPLPDGDYVITMLDGRLNVEAGARWLRSDPDTLGGESVAIFEAAGAAVEHMLKFPPGEGEEGMAHSRRLLWAAQKALAELVAQIQEPVMPAPVAVAEGGPRVQ